jgi:hypothetical protein
MHCPHCDRPSTFAVLEQGVEGSGLKVHFGVLRCNNPKCLKRVYVQTSKTAGQPQFQARDVLDYYPSGPSPTAHQSIPEPIAKDWVEAQKCFNVGATKATAMTCRRILYGVILHKQCPEHPLHVGILKLVNQERLPSIVEQWLGEIKDDGHDAAHPSRALDVSDENVLETMGYTKELLRFVYIEPFELQGRLARKANTAAAAQNP